MIKIGILGSGKGSNCRAILQSIRDGRLKAKATVVISDVLECADSEIARVRSGERYLPPGHFSDQAEPKVEAQLVEMLAGCRSANCRSGWFHACLEGTNAGRFPAPNRQHSSLAPAEVPGPGSMETGTCS